VFTRKEILVKFDADPVFPVMDNHYQTNRWRSSSGDYIL